MNEKGLIKLKEQIDASKTQISELTGKLNYLHKQLYDEFGCKTVKEAEIELRRLEVRVRRLEHKIEVRCSSIEEQLERINDDGGHSESA
jgi:chromosome segregation ATPase